MRTLRLWLVTLLLWNVSGVLPITTAQTLSFAQGFDSFPRSRGRVSEEDLLPETLPRRRHGESSPLPPVPAASEGPATTAPFPPPLPSVVPEGTTVTTPSPPSLPAEAGLSPQEVVALRFVEVGKGFWEQENLERAQEQFERAVSIAPLQPYSYYFLGRIAFSRGDHKEALAFLGKAELSFTPRDRTWLSETISLQGAIYEEMGDYAHARAAYQRCLQLTPTNLKALSALARLSEGEPSPGDTFPYQPTDHPWD